MHNYRIIASTELSAAHKKELLASLDEHAYQKAGLGVNNGSLALVILNAKDEFLAGIQGYIYHGCCNIGLLSVRAEARGNGLGSQLLKKAEAIASERGCLFITVSTMDFKGKPFYEKHGYRTEFIREGFAKGAIMYCMRKDIAK